MEVTVGPFITSFLVVIILTIYTYVIIYVRKGLLYQNMKFAFMLISLILIRMLLPINFPFTISIYSDKLLAFINKKVFRNIGTSNIRPIDLLFMIWLAGAIITLVFFLYRQVKFRATLNAFLIKNLENYPDIKSVLDECGAPSDIRVGLVPDDIVPGIFGVRHPILLLPDRRYTSRELYYICKHEVEHYKNHDLWLSLFLKLVVCVQWFNYLAYRLEKEMTLAFEVANDQVVLNGCSEEERIEYANYVAAVSDGTKRCKKGYGVSFVSFCRPESKTRIEYILAKKEERAAKKRNIWLHYVFIIVLFLASFFVVPEGYCTETRDNEGAISISESNSYIIDTGTEYKLYVDGKYMFTLSPIPEDFKDLPIIEEDEYET